jgi:hypothetical protein
MDYALAIMFILPQAKWRYSSDTIPEQGWTYNDIVWEDLFFPKPTEQELATAYKYATLSANTDYRLERQKHYPTPDQQLQMIFDLGIDGWKAKIQNVKDNIPKPAITE